MREKIHLAFNPDTMTVSDLKQCAESLRIILQLVEKHGFHADDDILCFVHSLKNTYTTKETE